LTSYVQYNKNEHVEQTEEIIILQKVTLDEIAGKVDLFKTSQGAEKSLFLQKKRILVRLRQLQKFQLDRNQEEGDTVETSSSKTTEEVSKK
jgi:hypothetical protein